MVASAVPEQVPHCSVSCELSLTVSSKTSDQATFPVFGSTTPHFTTSSCLLGGSLQDKLPPTQEFQTPIIYLLRVHSPVGSGGSSRSCTWHQLGEWRVCKIHFSDGSHTWLGASLVLHAGLSGQLRGLPHRMALGFREGGSGSCLFS